MLDCWFVGGDDLIWSFAQLIAPVVTTQHLHRPWLQ